MENLDSDQIRANAFVDFATLVAFLEQKLKEPQNAALIKAYGDTLAQLLETPLGYNLAGTAKTQWNPSPEPKQSKG
ncbi:hypothetical protein PPSIR1_20874 [Plesiocystis pacifica SIR-1]|uniref:Uncharacterized protein n=1 Tax=Plesiocystis pacifica SIR-1 TaxID=391625 RepID=A6GGU0_9BACT|nr:hypothetical protein [Plesiocystis pacifica]EDM74937.1 hypothetical protein PPSIR1_20874 [Plesiocystis pacifica SIR-1]